MGCCGEREKLGVLRQEQKWEYINLDDFKSTSCWTPFAYCYLVVMLFVSVSVYAVDTFTAINLLVFDRWSGQIRPKIPLHISRWIFAGCIILSFILLLYRWLRAIRVMKQGGVAKSYLDPLAVRIQSVRMGKEGRGWKRFLVFAELTKSKKGADYVALFAHYSFEAWLRICFAEGPRQVLNAITLYSVMNANLIPKGDHSATDGHTPIIQFFVNIGVLAGTNRLQVVVLFGMLWTLFIWLISAISLMVSIILYLVFLWHHIPSDDGSLTAYCRNKINRRMERIVRTKTDKALKKENQLRARQEAREAREGGGLKKQPTLPNVAAFGDDDSLAELSRQTTMTTLPEYSSRPQTGRTSDENLPSQQPYLNEMNGSGRPGPKRNMTHGSDASWSSYNSNAPLLNSNDMRYPPQPPSERSQTPGSTMSGPWNARNGPNRTMTGMSQFSQRPLSPGPIRPGTAQGGRNTPGTYAMEPIQRPGTATSMGSRGQRPSETEPMLPYPSGSNTSFTTAPSMQSSGPSWPNNFSESPVDMQGRRTPASAPVNPYFPPISEQGGRNSPAIAPYRPQGPGRGPPERAFSPVGPPSNRSMTPVGGPGPTLPRVQPLNSSAGGYAAFSPEQRSMTPMSTAPRDPPYPGPPRVDPGYGAYQSQGGRQTPLGGGDMSGRRLPPGRQDSGRVDDILNHY